MEIPTDYSLKSVDSTLHCPECEESRQLAGNLGRRMDKNDKQHVQVEKTLCFAT